MRFFPAGRMGRKRAPGAAPVVHRTARCGLRVTRGQRRRLFGLLRSAGDVWCCVAAAPSPLPTKQGSRTAAPAGTCQVPDCRDVTPGAGPHHGQRPGVPWPEPARPANHQVGRESLA